MLYIMFMRKSATDASIALQDDEDDDQLQVRRSDEHELRQTRNYRDGYIYSVTRHQLYYYNHGYTKQKVNTRRHYGR